MSIVRGPHTKLTPAGTNGGTTPAINTTGMNLAVISVSISRANTPLISDSKSNTWIPLTASASATNQQSKLFYCLNFTTDAAQTFSIAGSPSGGFSSIEVATYSGVDSFYIEAGTVSDVTGTTIKPGSVTPAVAGSLIVTGIATDVAGTHTPDSSFNLTDKVDTVGGTNFGGAMADLIPSTTAAVDMQWTVPSMPTRASRVAVFSPKVATGSGIMGFAGIAFVGVGGRQESGAGNLAFNGISFSGTGGRAETATANLAFQGISFTASGNVTHIKGAGNLAFRGISIVAGAVNAGIPGSGLRQFWTF